LCEVPSTRTGNAGNEETEIKQETDSTESYRTGNSGNEETEIKQETESTYTYAYSVIFKEEHGQVKEEVTEEQRGTDLQVNEVEDPPTTEVEDPPTTEGEDPPTTEVEDPPTNEGEDPPTTEGEDPPTTEGEDPPTNEGEDLSVVEMKYEEEEGNNLQVTTPVLVFHVIVLSLSSLEAQYSTNIFISS
jgi:hypothetical protein